MTSNISELRQDIVTGDWILIATGRMKRPDRFAEKVLPYKTTINSEANDKRSSLGKVSKDEVIKNCPFDNLEKTGNEESVLVYPDSDNWFVQVIPNKYPAFRKHDNLNKREVGPYRVMDGVGFHEVVIYRDHFKHLSDFTRDEFVFLLDVYQKRYLALMNKKFVDYISIFHNYGKEAGASIDHPHSQLIAAPIVPPDIHKSIVGSTEYHNKHKRCVHCVMIDWEREDQQRIIFENDEFIAFCPFISKVAFEIRIFPKDHKPYFERINSSDKEELSEAFGDIIRKIKNKLDDAAFNFFIHTAPCDGKVYPHYHWHLEIVPKTSVWAGFELSTGVEISTVSPEQAAEFLRR